MEKHASIMVTGAGSGIGLETVRALLALASFDVVAVARHGKRRLEQELQAHPGRLHVLELDLLSEDAAERIAASMGDKRLIGLVHNAAMLIQAGKGGYDRGPLMDLLALNVALPLLLTQTLKGNLAGDPPAHVVCIGSMGGFQDSVKFPGLAAYSSSKAALACFAQCAAVEFAPLGIRSNCLALGSVDTAMLRAAFPDHRASTSAAEMGRYVAEFTLQGHKLYNGKVLPVAVSTP